MIDTPIAEEGFVGAAFGAAWMGERPIVELQFADFVSCAFDPIVTLAAKTHWRSGIRLPLVIRLPSGGGVRGGPFHASSPEGWFVRAAGLKVVLPATVADAYGLLRSAIEDDDPVLYFEHKALYRRLRGEAPERVTRTPIGRRRSRARQRRHGRDLRRRASTLALDVAEALAGGPRLEVVDLRTLWPLDRATVLESVARTSRAARAAGGRPLDRRRDAVLSLVAAEGFERLDAPTAVVAPPDTPVPYAPELEDAYLPSAARSPRRHCEELLAY